MSPLKPQEARILAAVQPLEEKLGRRPYQIEIANAAGFRSKACANKYLKSLEAKGYIERDYAGRHTLRVRAEPNDALIARPKPSSDDKPPQEPSLWDIPQS